MRSLYFLRCFISTASGTRANRAHLNTTFVLARRICANDVNSRVLQGVLRDGSVLSAPWANPKPRHSSTAVSKAKYSGTPNYPDLDSPDGQDINSHGLEQRDGGDARGQAQTYEIGRGELMDLVDFYHESGPNFRVAQNRLPQVTNADTLNEDHEDALSKSNAKNMLPPDETAVVAASELTEQLMIPTADHEELIHLYRQLPEPRTSYLSRSALMSLLDHLSVVKFKSDSTARRYFTIFNDLKSTEHLLKVSHWNSAITFAARSSSRVTAHHLQQALNIWREMEDKGGIMANYVTFNILFDVATKAKKYVLADMIADEMKTRSLDSSRFFLTSKMIHWGSRGNGEMVRQAYQQLIAAEEIIDTHVMNCVIAALLKCGEATSAELTFERIKRLHTSRTSSPLPAQDWRERRLNARQLSLGGYERRQAKASLEGPFSPNPAPIPYDTSSTGNFAPTTDVSRCESTLEDPSPTDEHCEGSIETSIAPDLTTFKLLIRYNAIVMGDIERAALLVEEMDQFAVPLDGSIFLYLFKAFHAHGGALYTQWTIQRLENTFASYVKAVDTDQGAGRIYVSPAMCVVVIKAYLKCCGAGRCAEVWLELRARLPQRLEEDIEHIELEIRATMGTHEAFFLDILQRIDPQRGVRARTDHRPRTDGDVELEKLEHGINF